MDNKCKQALKDIQEEINNYINIDLCYGGITLRDSIQEILKRYKVGRK